MLAQQHIGVAEISLSGSSSSSSDDSETTASHDSSTMSETVPEYVVRRKGSSSPASHLEEKNIPRQVQLTGAGGLEALSVAASLMSRS
jgi:hypothetical protein